MYDYVHACVTGAFGVGGSKTFKVLWAKVLFHMDCLFVSLLNPIIFTKLLKRKKETDFLKHFYSRDSHLSQPFIITDLLKYVSAKSGFKLQL